MKTYKARQADTTQDKGFPDDFLVYWAWSPRFIRAVSGNRAASAACARQPESLCLTRSCLKRVAVISENLFHSIHTHTVDGAAVVILLGDETHAIPLLDPAAELLPKYPSIAFGDDVVVIFHGKSRVVRRYHLLHRITGEPAHIVVYGMMQQMKNRGKFIRIADIKTAT